MIDVSTLTEAEIAEYRKQFAKEIRKRKGGIQKKTALSIIIDLNEQVIVIDREWPDNLADSINNGEVNFTWKFSDRYVDDSWNSCYVLYNTQLIDGKTYIMGFVKGCDVYEGESYYVIDWNVKPAKKTTKKRLNDQDEVIVDYKYESIRDLAEGEFFSVIGGHVNEPLEDMIEKMGWEVEPGDVLTLKDPDICQEYLTAVVVGDWDAPHGWSQFECKHP